MKKTKIKPYLYLAPALLLAFVFVYYPLIKTFISSFFSISFNGKLKNFVFFANYKSLFSRNELAHSIWVTLRFAIFFVPLNTITILFASLLCEKESKASKFFETGFFLPLALSLSSACLVFKFLFNPSLGIINSALHLNINWIDSTAGANVSLLLLCLFLDFGINFILLLSALRSIDKSVIQAALLDGANVWTMVWKIKLPLIKPTLSFIIFMGVRDSLLMTVPPMILTEGGPFNETQTLIYYYYNLVFRSNSYGQGAAICALIFLFCITVSLLYNAFKTRKYRGVL